MASAMFVLLAANMGVFALRSSAGCIFSTGREKNRVPWRLLCASKNVEPVVSS